MQKVEPTIIQQQRTWTGQKIYKHMNEQPIPLSDKEWRAILDQFLISESVDMEMYERCDDAQRWLIGEIRKAINRIKYKI